MKKEYLLLIIVIAGLSALLFYQKKDRTNYQLPALSALEGQGDRLVLEQGQEIAELRLKDGKWLLGGKQYPVAPARVEKMLDEIRNLKFSALVSDKGNLELYELEPEKRLTATLYQDDQVLRRVQIGKTSSSFRQSYIMFDNDQRVYQVLGNLKSNFFTSANELRDKTVFTLSEKERQSLTGIKLARLVDGESRSLELQRPPADLKTDASEAVQEAPDEVAAASKTAAVPGWQLADGQPVAGPAVKELLNSLTDLKCESFQPDLDPAVFAEAAVFVIELSGPDGEKRLALLAPGEDKKYPALSSQNPEAFLLPSWKVDKLMRDFSQYTGEKVSP